MGFNIGDQDNGTLAGLRELLRRAAEQRAQDFSVEESSGEKHYADGGEVMKEKQDRPYTGVENAKKPDMNAVEEALNQIAKRDTRISLHVPTPTGGVAPGVMVGKRFAHGGMVDPNDIPPPEQPMAVPPLNDMASSLNKTPDTDYTFFNNGLSADDRAAMQQKLMQQQNSAPSLVAQGAAGLGDAISNSFGGKNTTFQKDVMANNEMQQKKQLEMVDTHRSQKMQDMNANLEMQTNDPSSPLSQSMRAIAKSQGVPVPSGMPASVMMKVLGPLGELAMKQATLEQTKLFQKGQLENQEEARKIEATKAVGNQGIVQRMLHPEVTKQLEQEAGMSGGHGIPDLGQTFNGGKVLKVTRIK